MKKRVFGKLLLALGALVLGTASMQAAAVLDFQLGGAGGGSVSWAGGSAGLVGANIPIRLVAATGTPLNNGASLVTNAVLSFSTGGFSGVDASGNYVFGSSGTISIVGDIASLGLTNATLLSGNFIGATYNPLGGLASLVVGFGSDTKDPTLVSYFFGANPPAGWSFAGTLIGTAVSSPGSGFSFTPNSVDIQNTSVPEPGSVLLLGTAMVGVAAAMRRRMKKSTEA